MGESFFTWYSQEISQSNIHTNSNKIPHKWIYKKNSILLFLWFTYTFVCFCSGTDFCSVTHQKFQDSSTICMKRKTRQNKRPKVQSCSVKPKLLLSLFQNFVLYDISYREYRISAWCIMSIAQNVQNHTISLFFTQTDFKLSF